MKCNFKYIPKNESSSGLQLKNKVHSRLGKINKVGKVSGADCKAFSKFIRNLDLGIDSWELQVCGGYVSGCVFYSKVSEMEWGDANRQT